MIGYGIFFCDKLCRIKENATYAICLKKPYAEDYAKELSAAMDLEYTVKKVSIEVLE